MPQKTIKSLGQIGPIILVPLLLLAGVLWLRGDIDSVSVQAADKSENFQNNNEQPGGIPRRQAEDACYCSSDIYNCNNFDDQQEAQTCFNDCQAVGRGDIHGLDSDGNGLACEELPPGPTPTTVRPDATPFTDPALNDPV